MYGTLSLIDTLATYNQASVLDVGEEEINGFIQQILAAYNVQVGEMLSDLVGVVPDRETTYGIDTTTDDMVDLDEFGLADASKLPFAPATVGFPLRKKGKTLQWTKDYLAMTTPAELGRQILGFTEADTRMFRSLILRTLLTATNNTTYIDRFIDSKVLALRALVNADSQVIPPAPITGTIFNPATHTHYLATASYIEANLVAEVETVREHGLNGGQLRVYINQAQEAATRAFAGFIPYVDSRLIYTTDATRAAQTVDLIQIEDRAIGLHGPAEVWVKSWWPANYVLAFRDGGGGDPVIGWRKPEGSRASWADLRLAANLDRHPLHAQGYERYLGMSVWNRVRAAVLYTGGGSWVNYAG